MITNRSAVLLLLFMGSASARTEQPFYEYINEILIKSAPSKQAPNRSKKAKNKKVPENKPICEKDLAVKTLKDIEQKLLFVQLLQEEHPDKTFSNVLDKTSIESLELINRGEQFAALSRKFGVQTLFGDVMLTSLLACPLSDKAAIIQRQNFVRFLGENQHAENILNSALKEVHAGQEMLLTFFDDANAIDEQLLKQVYGPFGRSILATISYQTFDRLSMAFSFLMPLASGLSAVDNYKNIKKFLSDQPLTQAEKLAFVTTITTGFSLKAIKRAPKTFIDWHDPRKFLEDTGPTLTNKIGWATLRCGRTLGYDAFIAWTYYVRYRAEKINSAIYKNMQKRLMGVSKIVRSLQRINALVQEQPMLLTQVPELAPIVEFLNTHNNPELQKLLRLLQTSTFEGEPSYFSNHIRILRAYDLMCTHKQEFVPALEAIGVLDNFAAAAKLVAHGPTGSYCYVTLLDNQLPAINLHKFWNPLITFEQAKTNDATLGYIGDANMMLTGPNGSGKSTNMKAIVLNVLLAQTFGIAASENAAVTPFDKIYTYINVQENIQEGMSTFMAEAQRLEEINRAIASTATNKRCLTVIDEGMRGTVAAEGVARLTEVCQRICRISQSICVLATHFEEPTKLQEETNGLWVNYYVEINEPTPGEFERLFTLKRGTNNWWFTDEQKRKRFVDWLVKISAK